MWLLQSYRIFVVAVAVAAVVVVVRRVRPSSGSRNGSSSMIRTSFRDICCSNL